MAATNCLSVAVDPDAHVAEASEPEQSLDDCEEGSGENEIDTETDNLDVSGATMGEALAPATPNVRIQEKCSRNETSETAKRKP